MTIMPLMFGIFSLSFASGLSIYFIASNLIGIAQYALMGKIGWQSVSGRAPAEAEAKGLPRTAEADPVADEVAEDAVQAKPKRGTGKAARAQQKQAQPKKPAPKPNTSSAAPIVKPKRSGIRDTRLERSQSKSKAKS